MAHTAPKHQATTGHQRLREWVEEMAAMTQPSGRYSKPEEIAGQIAFLLSDTAANITGTELRADGGYAI